MASPPGTYICGCQRIASTLEHVEQARSEFAGTSSGNATGNPTFKCKAALIRPNLPIAVVSPMPAMSISSKSSNASENSTTENIEHENVTAEALNEAESDTEIDAAFYAELDAELGVQFVDEVEVNLEQVEETNTSSDSDNAGVSESSEEDANNTNEILDVVPVLPVEQRRYTRRGRGIKERASVNTRAGPVTRSVSAGRAEAQRRETRGRPSRRRRSRGAVH